jgi:hypothetical protein
MMLNLKEMEKRGPGRPKGSKNKPKEEDKSPAGGANGVSNLRNPTDKASKGANA